MWKFVVVNVVYYMVIIYMPLPKKSSKFNIVQNSQDPIPAIHLLTPVKCSCTICTGDH